MGSRNYASAIALSALLGCSASSNQSKDLSYIESPVASPAEEKALQNYLSSLRQNAEPLSVDPFRGKRITLMYATGSMGGGPGGIPRPLDADFFNEVRRDLEERKAYILPHGVWNGDYSRDLALGRAPNMSRADLTIIADRNQLNLTGDLSNVYITLPKGKGYDFVEAKKND